MARAKFLSSSALIDGLEKICSFCVEYINQREAPSCLVRLTEQIIMLANRSSGQDILGRMWIFFLLFFFLEKKRESCHFVSPFTKSGR